MKKLGLMVVGAFFAFATTSAVAQTVKETKEQKTVVKPNKKGDIVIDGKTVKQKPGVAQQRPGTAAQAGKEYSTSPRGGVNSYADQVDNNHQGAGAENGEETVTILHKDAATIAPTKKDSLAMKDSLAKKAAVKVKP